MCTLPSIMVSNIRHLVQHSSHMSSWTSSKPSIFLKLLRSLFATLVRSRCYRMQASCFCHFCCQHPTFEQYFSIKGIYFLLQPGRVTSSNPAHIRYVHQQNFKWSGNEMQCSTFCRFENRMQFCVAYFACLLFKPAGLTSSGKLMIKYSLSSTPEWKHILKYLR